MGTVKKGPSEQDVLDAHEALNAIATGRESKLTWAEAFSVLEQAPDGAMRTLNADYLELKCGEVYNMAFDGMDTATLDGKTVEVVRLIDSKGNRFIHGSTVLVNACKKLQTIPCMIRITVKPDMVKTNTGGKYFDLTVKTF
jgi:hypothetical protein